MPFCPQCRTEYVEGVEVCPECDVALTHELPPAGPVPEVDFVVLTEGQTEVVINVLRAELEAANIPSYVSGDTLESLKVVPGYDAKVFVPKQHLELAREILNEILSGPPLEEEVDLESKYFCDACGAEVPSDATTCPECGELLEFAAEETAVCEHCGAEVPADASACPECGKSFAKK